MLMVEIQILAGKHSWVGDVEMGISRVEGVIWQQAPPGLEVKRQVSIAGTDPGDPSGLPGNYIG